MEIFIAIVQLLTLIIIIWYTVETNKLRKGQNKIIQQNVESVEPNVIVSFEEGEKFTEICIEIENKGKQTAFDIEISIIPNFDVKNNVYNKYVNENGALSKGISLLKGGKIIRIYSASTVDASKFYKENDLNTEYTFNVVYRDLNKNSFVKNYKDSIDKFFTRMHPEVKSDECRALEKINFSLHEISTKLRNKDESEQ